MQCACHVSNKSTDIDNVINLHFKKMESEDFCETFGDFRHVYVSDEQDTGFHKSSLSKFQVYYRVKQRTYMSLYKIWSNEASN